MNERIRELALEARIAYYSKNGSYEGSDDGLSVIPSTQSLEKFAELIVEECIVIMNREIDEKESKEKNRTISDMMDLLEEHFGVEE